MTDAEMDELDKLLAVKICGWRQSNANGWIHWVDAQMRRKALVQKWHPTRNREQAMMVAEAMRQMGYRTSWEAFPADYASPDWAGKHVFSLRWDTRRRMPNKGWPNSTRVLADTLPLAICLAVKPIAEAME